MTTRIQSIHFDADFKLIQQIHSQIDRLSKYAAHKAVEAEVFLKLEHVGKIQDKVVEIVLKLQGQLLIAKSTHKSFEKALRDAIATLKSQLLRYKEKIQNKHSRH
jgi:putative sigma-54 modulation protein